MSVSQTYALAGFGLVAVAAVGAALVAWWKRRRGESATALAWTWREEPAEPWGTVLLLVFLVSPFVTAGTRLIGVPNLAPFVLLGLVLLLLKVLRVTDQIRRIEVDAAGVEIRGVFRRRLRIELRDIVEVRADGPCPVVRCYNGKQIVFPGDERAWTVARNLAALIGRPIPDHHEPDDANPVPEPD